MGKLWLFRCDGGPTIGLGHIHRCLALMEALDEREVAVALATLTPDEVPQDAPFPVYTLRTAGHGLDAVSELAYLARSLRAQGIVFDHYGVDNEYFLRLRGVCQNQLHLIAIGNSVVLTDELSLTIRQTIRSPGQPRERELAGPEYLLVRKAFRKRPKRVIGLPVRRILVTLGGSDSAFLRVVLSAFNRLPASEPLEILVVGRRMYADGLESSVHKVTFLGLVTDMVGLLESVDLAVTACGTTLYQIAACGLPAIGIALAANQLQQAVNFANAGLIHYLGPAESVDERVLAQAVSDLILSWSYRQTMSRQGQSLVDGCGALRCADRLLAL